jgi:hypothetical protein
MTATVDGQSWVAGTAGLSAQVAAGVHGGFVVVGTEVISVGNSLSISFSLYNIVDTGSYALGGTTSIVGGTASLTALSGTWQTPMSGAAGTVHLTTYTATRVAGTFEFTAPGLNGTAIGTTRVVTAGAFDVVLTGTIVPPGPKDGAIVTGTFGADPFNAAFVSPLPSANNGFVFGADNNQYALILIMDSIAAPGTYGLNILAPFHNMTVGAGIGDTTGLHCCWGTSPGDSATIVVTSITANRVKGTFTAKLQPQAGHPGLQPLVITNGTFDVGRP